MSLSVAPARPTAVGLLQDAVGEGFAQALQDGLSRSFHARSYATDIRGPRRQDVSRTRAGAVEPGRPGSVLRPGDRAAIVERFEDSLADAFGEGIHHATGARSDLLAYARRILRAATGEAATPSGTLPPHHAATAYALLMECAMLHVLESEGGADGGLRRGAALVRELSGAIRREQLRPPAALPDNGDGGNSGVDEALWDERRRLARDMHDEVGTALSVALLRTELHATECADLSGDMATVRKSLRQAVGHTRDLVHGLQGNATLPPLREAIQAFIADAVPECADVTLKTTGNEQLLCDAHRRELFLAVRESLHNSFTHAPGARVTVTVRVTRRWAHARITDNGAGFDSVRMLTPGCGSQGLRSMAERIEGTGGRLTIESTPAHGTRVDVHMPLRARP